MASTMEFSDRLRSQISMHNVVINGKSYGNLKGSISVSNGKVYCNGHLVSDESGTPDKEINIIVKGNVEGDVVITSGMVTVKGSCRSVKTTSGDVRVEEDVTGNISTVSGDVTCGNDIGGNVNTVSGDIRCSSNRAGQAKSHISPPDIPLPSPSVSFPSNVRIRKTNGSEYADESLEGAIRKMREDLGLDNQRTEKPKKVKKEKVEKPSLRSRFMKTWLGQWLKE